MKTFVLLFAAVMNLLLADAVTKELAEHRLVSGDSFSVLPGFLDFALVHNRGCAWGMFQGHVWPLAAFGLVALAVLIARRRAIFNSRLARFAEPFLYAGILGNVVDRLYRGYVVDMIDFHWKNLYHYPCFNLADVCICLAAGLLILASFKDAVNKKKESKQ